MSEEATLDEFQNEPKTESNQEWQAVKLEDVSRKRSDNVDPQEVDLERHVGLEHIEPNTPYPQWESLDGLSSTKRRFESGDILFAKLRPNLEKSAQPDFEGVASADIFPIIAEQGVNSKYLLYRLSSKPVYDHSRRTSVGTRMPRTSWNLFSNFEFGLPPLGEQRKIATVLHTIDQAIQQTEEIIGQTHVVKNALMQDVFHGQYEEFETYESTPVGKIPSHWNDVTIGDVVHTAQYGISESLSEEGQYPIFRMNNVENGYMIEEPMKYIDLNDDEFEKYRVETGDILFNRTNSLELVGKTGIYELEGDHVFASYLVRLQTNEQANSYYLNYYMNSSEAQNRMMDFATKGVSQANINANSIQQVKLPLPPMDEQREIAERIRGVDSQIESNQRYIEQLKRLKQGLMQDLLSGAVRTHETDIDVPEAVLAHG
jgi:type I restriction enzyme S subunit